MVYSFYLLILLFFFGGEGASISVNWNQVTFVSKTTTTLQVVVNPYVQRGSPIHDALANLQADYVRFVPWLPYPQLGVAELQAPTGNPVCGSNVYGVFETIDFASFGSPDGRCGGFSVGECAYEDSLAVVQKLCLGQSSCLINITSDFFGPPCKVGTSRLAVQGSCSISSDTTFWNFTLIDPLMEDIMNATKNHSVIINFSTTPQWLWNTPGPVAYPFDPQEVTWSYEQGTTLRDPSLQDLGNYYKRLVSWYTNGGFYDEYSVYHKSGHYYNIPMWEVLNEIEAEHTMTPQTYTEIYDAIVGAILEVQPNMTFVGLALSTRNPDYVSYFIDPKNHVEGIPIDWISYHFYAGPNDRTNVSEYEGFFTAADQFFGEVEVIQGVRKSINPNVKTTIDELGVILPDDNVPDPVAIPPLYWNAAGAMYAYIFGNLILQGIEVVGESQLVGYPTQFPSVSLMDWETAKPNARFWVLSLLLSSFHVGDQLVETSCDDGDVYAQGFITPKGKIILIVNKTLLPKSIILEGFTTGKLDYVDEDTSESPAFSLPLSNNSFILSPFAVGVVTLSA